MGNTLHDKQRKGGNMNVNINPSFKALIPPLTKEEYGILKQSIDEEGCRERIIVWNNTIIDGHNRYEICRELNVEFDIVEWDFDSEDEAKIWIINNQLGRRNLTDFQKIELVEKKKNLLLGKGKEKREQNLKQNKTEVLSNNTSDNHSTRQQLAKEAGVTAAKLAQAEVLIKEAPEEMKQELREGKKKIGEAYREFQETKKELQEAQNSEKHKTYVSLPEWADEGCGGTYWSTTAELVSGCLNGEPIPRELKVPQFNVTNEMIEWAGRSWNPVTGCEHGCPYCYARDIANRFYKDLGFEPALWPERLLMPFVSTYKNGAPLKDRMVFVSSMGDLFGDWVPEIWIDKVIQAIEAAPQWYFTFLTKNPKRYLDFTFPKNVWLGMTADTDKRYHESVPIARQLKEKGENLIFLSMEPLKERISIKKPMPFDWVIIGGQSKTSGEPECQPEWLWVEEILTCARECMCSVYFKPNLTARPRELPLQEKEYGHDARKK
jgi:protein gp37